jgi:DNA-binding GntR family transcriptional regulator
VPELITVSAQEALVSSLRERVFAGEFPPGTPISDVELAAEYGVARPTVRAAVQSLVHDGVLRREPRRRAYVPRLTAVDIRDLFYVRVPLEVAAVEALVDRRLVPAGAVEAVDELETAASWQEAGDADLRFHAALVGGVGSPRLERIYSSLSVEIRLALVQLTPVAYASVDALAAQHRHLLELIAGRSKRNATQAMRDHIAQGVEELTRTR